MIADIFYPIFILTITILACFMRKKKLFRGFAPTPSPGHYPGPPEGFQLLPLSPHLQSFLAFPKAEAPIFFCIIP